MAGPNYLSAEQPESGRPRRLRDFSRSRADSRRDRRRRDLSHDGNAVRQARGRRLRDVRAMEVAGVARGLTIATATPTILPCEGGHPVTPLPLSVADARARLRPREPVRTASLVEQRGFEPPVPFGSFAPGRPFEIPLVCDAAVR